MIGSLSPEECAERGRGCKGLLEEQVVEGERAAQEVGGMLRRGKQPAVLGPSPSSDRISGTWPATRENTQPQAYPSQRLWTIPAGCSRTAPLPKS